ncbi:unnamed protein product [marine sediment metagenome]|uniref:Uncharacterized protein n=1 Tax=marine sediment metagenome TaxID=412755 RepID=X1RDE8_9ZZZZ
MIYINGVAKPKLSALMIDVDKDWQNHTLTNIKKAVAAGQPLTIEQMIALVGYAWTGVAGDEYCCLTQDADYVYAGLYTTPAKVIKIDKSTMTTSAAWTGEVGENDCNAMTQDADYVYAGLGTSPAKVIKIAKSTMTTSAAWTGEAGDEQLPQPDPGRRLCLRRA